METGRTCDEKTLNSNSSGVETWRWQKKAQKMKRSWRGTFTINLEQDTKWKEAPELTEDKIQ